MIHSTFFFERIEFGEQTSVGFDSCILRKLLTLLEFN